MSETTLKTLERWFLAICILQFCIIALLTLIAMTVMDQRIIVTNQVSSVRQIVIEQTIEKQTSPTSTPKNLTLEEEINLYIVEVAKMYDFSPSIIKSMIYHESRFNPNETTGKCIGLMQVSTLYHTARAKELGVTNLYDPYGNILVGVDYIDQLKRKYGSMELALMMYNMNHKTALKMYNEGKVSYYAKSVLKRAKEYEKGE